MATEHAAPSTMSEDSFEFISTPGAPSPAPEANEYGVRTTSVSTNYFWSH